VFELLGLLNSSSENDLTSLKLTASPSVLDCEIASSSSLRLHEMFLPSLVFLMLKTLKALAIGVQGEEKFYEMPFVIIECCQSSYLVGIKSHLNAVRITVAHIDVNNALMKTQVVDGATTVMPIITAEEKAQRRIKEKARSTLMMGIPNEHQLKFNSIKDAKKLLEAVEKRLGMLDQTFDRLQKFSQEDVNQKLLRSLSPEWNTYVVVQRNKADLDTMRMDDLYNNLKVYEPEVKEMSSLNSNTQKMAFLSFTNSRTNGVVNTTQAVNTANEVCTASTQVNVAFSTNIDNLSDAVIYAFMASQPNSTQLTHEDLEQIHPDDMEEMDLRWQMTMLTIKARRFLKKTRRKLIVNGNETLSFDMSKVECYNCHKRGHFARECRASRNQDFKHKESTRRIVLMETHVSTALVSCDSLGGYDWIDQAEKGPTYTLMVYTS
nr:hypothetical protein [Tanacetum cinerariifolium]